MEIPFKGKKKTAYFSLITHSFPWPCIGWAVMEDEWMLTVVYISVNMFPGEDVACLITGVLSVITRDVRITDVNGENKVKQRLLKSGLPVGLQQGALHSEWLPTECSSLQGYIFSPPSCFPIYELWDSHPQTKGRIPEVHVVFSPSERCQSTEDVHAGSICNRHSLLQAQEPIGQNTLRHTRSAKM